MFINYLGMGIPKKLVYDDNTAVFALDSSVVQEVQELQTVFHTLLSCI